MYNFGVYLHLAIANNNSKETAFMQKPDFLYDFVVAFNVLEIVHAILLPFLLIEMLVIIDLGVNVHNDDHIGLRVIFDCNPNDVFTMDVDNVFDYLGLLYKLVGPDYLLLVCLYVLHDDRATAKVDKFGLSD